MNALTSILKIINMPYSANITFFTQRTRKSQKHGNEMIDDRRLKD